ncbi:hypothetical protein H0S70_06620 [Chryseobacterium manosquense]|uniref:DUF1360 domain-containing protein n=1 Tax=Chryseobacterium manosquense TaxID=2754694 RepID=A0A7H1E056_9FLAO|nr:hypothetical protein [Chryseobacterium manosquense]QNS42614.1 hypothetical protein H0S70_06620 [Chryseobacterium manosquense]
MEIIAEQLLKLLILAIPVACIAWTVTHEEIFREPREFCIEKSQSCRKLYQRKFFYLITCEYCFSHYVTLFFLLITGFNIFFDDWRGYLVAFFIIVMAANIYMSLFAYLRQSLKLEKIEAKLKDNEWHEVKEEIK